MSSMSSSGSPSGTRLHGSFSWKPGSLAAFPGRIARQPNTPKLRNIPQIIFRIPIAFEAFSLTKVYWALWLTIPFGRLVCLLGTCVVLVIAEWTWLVASLQLIVVFLSAVSGLRESEPERSA